MKIYKKIVSIYIKLLLLIIYYIIFINLLCKFIEYKILQKYKIIYSFSSTLYIQGI